MTGLVVAGKVLGRRDFIRRVAAGAAVGALGLGSHPAPAVTDPHKTLRIVRWAHFVPEFDTWFTNVAHEWGLQHQIHVSVDTLPVDGIHAAAMAEVASGKGHDICIFPWSPAEFHPHAIDHSDVYQQVAMKYGAIPQLAFRSTFNHETRTHFAFADFYTPSPLHFFQDYWSEVGMPLGPVHYGSLRSGGKRLRDKLGISCGLAMTATLEGNVTLHTLFYAMRAWVLDGSGAVTFNKNVFATEALKYLQALYQESGSPEQLAWGPGGNVKAMLARKTSATSNAISLLRAAERQEPRIASKIRLQPPLLGLNGMGVTALPHATNCSVVWKFSRNQDNARRFLADLVDYSKVGYEQSLGCNFPLYPKTLPDLIVRLSKDTHADPPYKYVELKDALHWTPNLGVPGFATPAYMEVFNSSLLPRMVRSVLVGEHSPEEAAAVAATEIAGVAAKWQRG
jgi:multiple sugar transport system substrate-binding protein